MRPHCCPILLSMQFDCCSPRGECLTPTVPGMGDTCLKFKLWKRPSRQLRMQHAALKAWGWSLKRLQLPPELLITRSLLHVLFDAAAMQEITAEH